MIKFIIFLSIFLLTKSTPLVISPTTHLFIDSLNRERFFHGVNIIMKRHPYYPITDHFDPLLSFHEIDMQNFEAWGLNIIRLGTQWPGYEPIQGQYNETYLDILEEIVNQSGQHNIYTLLDFHQDILNEKFCGEGIPSWAVKEPSEAWAFPRPVQLTPYKLNSEGLPSEEDCNTHGWAAYYFAYETAAAFQNLYDNVEGVQDNFGEFWRRVAERFDTNDYVMGYELINEPFAGNVITNPLRLTPTYADHYNLMPMYDYLNDYIRKNDTNHLVFFQSVTWDDMIPVGFSHPPGGEQYGNRSVLSYHYNEQVNFNLDWQVKARFNDRNRLQCGSMCTEFGSCPSSQKEFDDMESQMNVFDEYLESWIGWSSKLFGNYTGDCGTLYDNNGVLNMRVVEKLSRTYAQAVAGRTQSMKYDNVTKNFSLVYSICGECQGETEIYLNEDVHYENGFDVTVDGSVEWYQPKKNRVHLKRKESSKDGDLVKISISRKSNRANDEMNYLGEKAKITKIIN